jgi:hypothetical protein
MHHVDSATRSPLTHVGACRKAIAALQAQLLALAH